MANTPFTKLRHNMYVPYQCPLCEGDLVVRQNKKTKEFFVGCVYFSNPIPGTSYQTCNYTHPMTPEIKKKTLRFQNNRSGFKAVVYKPHHVRG